MKETGAINLFPRMQVKPFDGMSVTAEVWAQAHDEHRQALNAHNLVSHGSGILTGLEVTANDPADQYVFISPGAAVDPAGNIIVVPEAVTYDFGESSEGTLYLVLGKGEREVGGVGSDTRYLQSEFVIAARPTMPKRPAVELARVTLSKSGAAIHNAANPLRPAADMLDLRFRSQVGPAVPPLARVLVLAAGESGPAALSGWDHLTRACQQAGAYRLVVDAAASTLPDLGAYPLVYLGAGEGFAPEAGLVKALAAHLQQGRSLLLEALDAAAQPACQELLGLLQRSPAALPAGSPLLEEPYLFAAPPDGVGGNGVLLAGPVIYSTAAYSLAWAGRSAQGPAARADIRSAHEWGINLLRYSLKAAGV